MSCLCEELRHELFAFRWMEACLGEQLPPTTELEHGLRNGVYLGKLAKFFAPQLVSEKMIYDRDQSRYKVLIFWCYLLVFSNSLAQHRITVCYLTSTQRLLKSTCGKSHLLVNTGVNPKHWLCEHSQYVTVLCQDVPFQMQHRHPYILKVSFPWEEKE